MKNLNLNIFDENIEKILNDICFENFTKKEVLSALEDGAFLATKDWAQEDVEDAYNFLKARV